MRESEIRRRLTEVTKQLDEEKRARERAEQTAADLARALVQQQPEVCTSTPPLPPLPPLPPSPTPPPPPKPAPTRIPRRCLRLYATPLPDWPPTDFPIVTLYACQTFDPPVGNPPIITWSITSCLQKAGK